MSSENITPEIQHPSTAESQLPNKRLRHAVGRVALAAALLGTIGDTIAGEIYADEPLVFARLGIDYVTHQQCTTVSPQDLSDTSAITSLPAAPKAKSVMKSADDSLGDTVTNTISNEPFDTIVFNYANKEARVNNLSIVDSRPYRKQVDAATSVSQIQTATRSFLHQYDINMAMPQHGGIADIGVSFKPLETKTITLKQWKGVAGTLMGTFGVMPRQLVRAAEVHTIDIVDSLPSRPNPVFKSIEVAGETNPMTGILYLPLNDVNSLNADYNTALFADTVVVHEFSHRLDREVCGITGMSNDPGYEALNTPDFKYGSPADINKTDTAEAYGATDVLEDKATIAQGLLQGGQPNSYLNKSVVVTNKFNYLMARFNKRIPGLAAYFHSLWIIDN